MCLGGMDVLSVNMRREMLKQIVKGPDLRQPKNVELYPEDNGVVFKVFQIDG